jgi:hypothetical protein
LCDNIVKTSYISSIRIITGLHRGERHRPVNGKSISSILVAYPSPNGCYHQCMTNYPKHLAVRSKRCESSRLAKEDRSEAESWHTEEAARETRGGGGELPQLAFPISTGTMPYMRISALNGSANGLRRTIGSVYRLRKSALVFQIRTGLSASQMPHPTSTSTMTSCEGRREE